MKPEPKLTLEYLLLSYVALRLKERLTWKQRLMLLPSRAGRALSAVASVLSQQRSYFE